MSEHEPNQESLRANLTTKIWGCAIAMLGVSIPISAIVGSNFGSVIIPLSIIGGTTLSTIAIWNPLAARSKQAPKGSEAESQRVAELEERVASLEMILSYEEKLLESKMRQQPVLNEQAINQQPILSESSLPVANEFAL